MHISKSGYELIKNFEGVKTSSYQDSIGKWTIGIGFIMINNKPVKKGDIMTLDQIEAEFYKQITSYENGVMALVRKPLLQCQFDALVSFVFNLGVGALAGSTMLKLINVNPNDPQIAKEFVKWCKAGGKEVNGLKIRRAKEANYYFSNLN